jgi:rubrerythrin
MQLFKDIREVFDFAIEKEEASYQLYTKAAAMVASTASRKMLEEMAKQELGHKRLLQGMDREKVHEYRFVKVPDLKIGDYLVDVEYRDDMTFQEILVFAMKAEEQAARLYSEASHMTDVPELQRMLLMLANEEKKHKFNLESLYDDKILTEN